MGDYFGPAGGGGAPRWDYVQDTQPTDTAEGEKWYDTDDDEAYTFDDQGNPHRMTVTDFGEISGTLQLGSQSDTDLDGNDLDDAGTVVWDTSASQIPAARVEQGGGSDLNADQVDGYEIQKDGTDGTDIINFKT